MQKRLSVSPHASTGRRLSPRPPRSSPRTRPRPARPAPSGAVMPKIQEQVADVQDRDRHIHDLKKKLGDFKKSASTHLDRNRHLEAQVKEQSALPVASEELTQMRTKVDTLKKCKRQDAAQIAALKQQLAGAHRRQGPPSLLSDVWTPTSTPRGVECTTIGADNVVDSPQANVVQDLTGSCVLADAAVYCSEGQKGTPVPKPALGSRSGRAQAKPFGRCPGAVVATGKEASPQPAGERMERTPAEVNELLAVLESSCLDSGRDSIKNSVLEPTNLGDLVERVAQRVDLLLGEASFAANRASPVVSPQVQLGQLAESPPSASQDSNYSLGSPVLHIQALHAELLCRGQSLQDRDRELCLLQERLQIYEARLADAEGTLATERSTGLSLRLEAESLRRQYCSTTCTSSGKENDAPDSSMNFSVSDCSAPKPHCWPPQAPSSHKQWQASCSGSQSCSQLPLSSGSSWAGSHSFPQQPAVIVRGRSHSPALGRPLSQTHLRPVSISRSPSPALSCRSVRSVSPCRVVLSPRPPPPRVSASIRTLTQQVDMLVKVRDLPPRRQHRDGPLVLRSQWRMVRSPPRHA